MNGEGFAFWNWHGTQYGGWDMNKEIAGGLYYGSKYYHQHCRWLWNNLQSTRYTRRR